MHLHIMKFVNISIIQSAWSCCVIFTITIYIFDYPAGNRAILAYLEYNCKTCSEAQIMAMLDFEKGIARLTQGGMEESDRAAIRAGILKQDYGIETLYTGCVGTTDEVYCYTSMMARMLGQKYGWDFYDRASKKANDIIVKLPAVDYKYEVLAAPPPVKK
jgi:hypothetical protein